MRRSIGSLAFALLLGATGAAAQYPNKSIKLIVPYPPGGATDVIGRVLAQRLSTALGQQVVVVGSVPLVWVVHPSLPVVIKDANIKAD